MDLERREETPSRRGLSLPAQVAIGALALFGLVTLVQWALASLVGLVRFGLFVVIVVAVGAWVMNAKASR